MIDIENLKRLQVGATNGAKGTNYHTCSTSGHMVGKCDGAINRCSKPSKLSQRRIVPYWKEFIIGWMGGVFTSLLINVILGLVN